ncbi:MAG: peptidoglycan editing factor PgeF [Candidatus Woesebacteria bacterium]|nr:MAG: peptidoglycan editing factor PgeF [Candidatus Woesebacteria bacterium]
MQKIVLMQQIHGNNVVVVDKKDIGITVPNCDALITNDPDVTLCVRVADCLPIMISDEKGLGIGLIHAGWRGLENGIIEKTINGMKEKLKVKSEELKIKIGPHICAKHYEIKNDVSIKFSKYNNAVIEKERKIFLDLGEVARQQLVRLDVKNENIAIDPTCTFENKKLSSFRRDHTEKRNLYLLKIKHPK